MSWLGAIPTTENGTLAATSASVCRYGATAARTSRAHRAPMLLVWPVCANGRRTDVRNADGPFNHDPPRAIRANPAAAPGGSMDGDDP